MNPLASVLLAVAAGGGTAILVDTLRTPRDSTAPTTANDGELEALRATVANLKQEVAALRNLAATAPASSSDAPANDRTALPTLTDEQIGAALARYLAANGGKLPAEAAAAAGAPLDFDKAFAEILEKHSNFWENPDLYRKIHAAGKMDELVARMEQYAKEHANDPQAHMDLASTYLSYLQLDQTKWQFSMKADGSLDRALEIDENHWEARFTKAVSYSFWPDFLGKKKEAVEHFERLVTQQESMPAEAHQAETYLYLGNLLDQRGDHARAREVWERGFRRHPNNTALRDKLR